MAKGAYFGVGGILKKVKSAYVGVDGKARKIKKAYIGVGGVARLCWSAASAVTSSWPVYNGNDVHNAVVEKAPASTASGFDLINLTQALGIVGISSTPVMQTVDGVTYAYVLFDGHSAKAQMTKINCTTGTRMWSITFQNSSAGPQVSMPFLDVDSNTIYVAINKYSGYSDGVWTPDTASVYAVQNIQTNAPTIIGIILNAKGQISTPITHYGNYIYFGTWIGGSEAGSYYQVDTTNSSYAKKIFIFANNGFNNAGAVKSSDYVYFGSDNGKLCWRSTSDFLGEGDEVDLNDFVPFAGNVRSTVMLGDDGKLYFTSQGGYLWCCSLDPDQGVADVDWYVELGGTSTSTPTKVGNQIFTGFYSGFTSGGVQLTTLDADGVPTRDAATTIISGFPVQCSILAKTDGAVTATATHIYFNTNSATGAGYCYTADGALTWTTGANTCALGGMACDNGYIVFGNDYNNVWIVK